MIENFETRLRHLTLHQMNNTAADGTQIDTPSTMSKIRNRLFPLYGQSRILPPPSSMKEKTVHLIYILIEDEYEALELPLDPLDDPLLPFPAFPLLPEL